MRTESLHNGSNVSKIMSIMRAVMLRVGFAAVLLVCTLAAPITRADVFTWLDAAGRTNVSNLDPPEGARVTSVVRERPASAAEIAAREARQRADVIALEEQVRRLAAEVAATRQPRVVEAPPMPVVYNIITMPSPPVAVPDLSMAYADMAPAPSYDCIPSWAGCATWWPGFATGTVVVGSTHGHHFDSFNHGHRFHPHPSHPRGPFDFPSSLPATTGAPMRH
jgi:uncharacterized protein DUF4124